MKKSLAAKALLLIFLIVTLPITIPVAIADVTASDYTTPDPVTQCVEKYESHLSFIEFMDSGVIKNVERVAALLYVISTIVNTIDYFITLISSVIGMLGPTGDVCCPAAVIGPKGAAVCASNWAGFTAWESVKASGIFSMITNFATCACCSGTRSASGSGIAAKVGSNFNLCPLGDLANGLGESLPGVPTQPSQWSNNQATQSVGQASGEGELFKSSEGQYGRTGPGISQFHFSAFDNIYTAIGCMCPVAILFNLRKLKSIYQSHNCCVQEACASGISTEACERQLDEASCMYWEGSIAKTLLALLASIAVGYIAKAIIDSVAKSVLARCILLVLELIEIPGRVQATMGAFQWMQKTFKEPKCEDLGFDDIQDLLESGYDSQSAGIKYTMIDTNGDGIGDTLDPPKPKQT